MKPDIWNVLHDGSIVRICGAIPGDVQLAVEIRYLRARFPDPGDCLLLTLHGCTLLSYEDWTTGVISTDLAEIAASEPEILNSDEPTTVICNGGTLRIEAVDFSLALDNGRAITLEEWCAAAEAYWTEWSQRKR
jgi:hypothetical protein